VAGISSALRRVKLVSGRELEFSIGASQRSLRRAWRRPRDSITTTPDNQIGRYIIQAQPNGDTAVALIGDKVEDQLACLQGGVVGFPEPDDVEGISRRLLVVGDLKTCSASPWR
jgi:hypothetical protein